MDLPDYSAHLRLDELKAAGIDYSTIKTPENFFYAAMTIYNANPTTAEGETRYSLGLYNQGMPEYLSGYWGLKRGWQLNDDNRTKDETCICVGFKDFDAKKRVCDHEEQRRQLLGVHHRQVRKRRGRYEVARFHEIDDRLRAGADYEPIARKIGDVGLF